MKKILNNDILMFCLALGVIIGIAFVASNCATNVYSWIQPLITENLSADPDPPPNTAQFYSKNKIPYFIDPDGTTYDLSTSGGGGGGGSGVSWFFAELANGTETSVTTGQSVFIVDGGTGVVATLTKTGVSVVYTFNLVWTSGVTLPRLAGVTDYPQTQINIIDGRVTTLFGGTSKYATSEELSNQLQDSAFRASSTTNFAVNSEVTSHVVSALSPWATAVELSAQLGTGVISSTSLQALSVIEGKVDYGSGVSIASAVTKTFTKTAYNPCDLGGGSANTPFSVFFVYPHVYPKGIVITSLIAGGQGSGTGTLQINYSEWASGSSVDQVGTANKALNSGVSEDILDLSASGTSNIIEAGNEVFAHEEGGISGNSLMHVGFSYYPR